MRFSNFLVPVFCIIFFIQIPPVSASPNKYFLGYQLNDTSHSVGSGRVLGSGSNEMEQADAEDDSIEAELLDTGNVNIENNARQNALLHFVESNKLKNSFYDKKKINRVYTKLARAFARMKYYPVAMQYYLKTVLNNEWLYPDGASYGDNDELLFPAADSNYDNIINNTRSETEVFFKAPCLEFLSDGFQKKYFQNCQTFFASRRGSENNSVAISDDNILTPLEDGKKPVAYAVIIHVKQPKAGKRKAFTGLNNVGHTFVTLLKYNADSTCASRSFGFYPQKDNFLSATPLHPASSSVFKDDTVHDWDEAIGKFISERRFKKLIRLITKYEEKKYDLNNNNCTDFGLYAAAIAGISISNTNGNWPLGNGNNPGNAGQSILEGKFINADTGNTQGLFICADPRAK